MLGNDQARGASLGDRAHRRYRPGQCIGTKATITGNGDVSTSYAERHKRTMRIEIRRFTRLTNDFSNKLENHVASVALHSMHYNFVPMPSGHAGARGGRDGTAIGDGGDHRVVGPGLAPVRLSPVGSAQSILTALTHAPH
jgi:hypothetical protein